MAPREADWNGQNMNVIKVVNKSIQYGILINYS